MRFDRMPPDWPNRAAARRIPLRPNDWCVLETGTGPTMLLLHGAGGSGHSFRHMIPRLAPDFHLVVPDLPGQGFTHAGNRGRLGLDAMAEDIARLCIAEGWAPQIILGHSAGGAVALRLAELLADKPRAVVGINAALGSFEGAAGVLFPAMARVLALMPLVPQVVARLWGTPDRVGSLLGSTGSAIDPAGAAQYLTLVRDADHIEGTLGMMAQWNLTAMLARLPRNAVPTLLLTGARDRTVPPEFSRRAAARMPDATHVDLPGLGHLMQEEAADAVCDALRAWLAARAAAAAT